MSDLQQCAIYITAIVILILLSEQLKKRLKLPSSFTRKCVHFGVGILSMATVYFFNDPFLLIVTGGLFVIINGMITYTDIFPGLKSSRKTLGLAYFPLAFIILLFLFWDSQKYLILYGLAQLTFADSFASLVGEHFKSREFTWLTDKKSILGTTALFITSLVISAVFFLIQPLDMPQNPGYLHMVLITLMLAVISVLSEAMSVHGTDNISLPVISSLFFMLAIESFSDFISSFAFTSILAFLLGAAALKKRWLTEGGVAMMFLQSYMIICFGSMKMIIPMLLFFLLSSVISKVTDRFRKSDEIEKKGSERDGWQVFANGSFPAALAVLYHFFPNISIPVAFAVSICAAVSDTWSSEIGSLSKKNPISIITLKPVQKGISGGVSAVGTLGGFLGALVITVVFALLFPELITMKTALVIFICGAFGTVADSILGALVQLKLKCQACGKITEKDYHCGKKTLYHSGLKLINNDMVNWLSIGITVVLALTLSSGFNA